MMEFADVSSGHYIVEYLPVLLFLFIAAALVLTLLFTSLFISPRYPIKAKLLPYECGIEPFEGAHRQFNIKFYMVAILFIILDLEIIFMYPWALAILDMSIYGFMSMMIFLFIMTLGFIYEWKVGALEWS